MKKENILKRIEKLSKLCEETEPTSKELMYMDKLFSQDLIDVDSCFILLSICSRFIYLPIIV